MRFWLAKVRRAGKVGLIPTDDESRVAISKMADGECVQVEISRPRSVPYNRLYWGLCRTIGENQDPPRDEDSIDAELRILAGHYEVMYFDGRKVFVPKRIAFDKLDADGWNEYFRKAEVAIAERFGAEYLPSQAA